MENKVIVAVVLSEAYYYIIREEVCKCAKGQGQHAIQQITLAHVECLSLTALYRSR